MLKKFKRNIDLSTCLISLLFAIVPEKMFGNIKLIEIMSNEINIVLVRFLVFIIIFGLINLIQFICLCFQNKVTTTYNENTIQIEYGDLLKKYKIKKVLSKCKLTKNILDKPNKFVTIIPFDECFTCELGDKISDIKITSLCGQYLKLSELTHDDIESLITKHNIKPLENESNFNNNKCYKLGTLVPNDDYFLLAFAKLNEKGRAVITHQEFIDCLFTLWEELNNHYPDKDVCIPIIGSGRTQFTDVKLSQLELLDTIIATYKLSKYKIKKPNKLRIVCHKKNKFKFNNIGKYI